jgi:hypothetical protein
MSEHYLGNMRPVSSEKFVRAVSAQIVNREVRHLLVISFQHELHQVAADAHMEAFTHRLIFILRENKRPGARSIARFIMAHFWNYRTKYRFLLFRPVLWFSHGTVQILLFKIECDNFSFASPPTLHAHSSDSL